ncbi:MAG: Asp23/Gls24 family envelope stress response protein [Clostridia bacterium]|nr:Asp23/Gls24 family envelope stress response protein [Clostridia bacterium]
MTETITQITKEATLSTKGVASLGNPIDVYLNKKKEKYDVDVFLNVYFGVKIPEIAWDVQENVHTALINAKIDVVEHINIHVQGVKPLKEENE